MLEAGFAGLESYEDFLRVASAPGDKPVDAVDTLWQSGDGGLSPFW
jgi:hypothetical protein